MIIPIICIRQTLVLSLDKNIFYNQNDVKVQVCEPSKVGQAATVVSF